MRRQNKVFKGETVRYNVGENDAVRHYRVSQVTDQSNISLKLSKGGSISVERSGEYWGPAIPPAPVSPFVNLPTAPFDSSVYADYLLSEFGDSTPITNSSNSFAADWADSNGTVTIQIYEFLDIYDQTTFIGAFDEFDLSPFPKIAVYQTSTETFQDFIASSTIQTSNQNEKLFLIIIPSETLPMGFGVAGDQFQFEFPPSGGASDNTYSHVYTI